MTSPEVTLALVGDVMLAGPLRGPGDPGVQRLLGESQLVFANLEVPLTNRGYPADKAITFRSPPELASELRHFGFDVVTIANNHALDYGPEGLLQTLDVVRGADVAIVGGGRERNEALAPAFFEVGGLRIAFLGLACTLPPGYAASEQRPGIAGIRVISQFVVDAVSLDEQPGMAPFVSTWTLEDDVAVACDAIRAARRQSDLVVVGIHWGVPNGWVARYQDVLASYQLPLGHALVDAGADLVVGHHPHCLHGIEQWGRGWILYSVGNFLFHSLGEGSALALSRPYPPYLLESLSGREAKESAIFTVRAGSTGVEQLEITPVLLDDSGEPRLLRGDDARRVLERVDALSRPLGVSLDIDLNRGTGVVTGQAEG